MRRMKGQSRESIVRQRVERKVRQVPRFMSAEICLARVTSVRSEHNKWCCQPPP